MPSFDCFAKREERKQEALREKMLRRAYEDRARNAAERTVRPHSSYEPRRRDHNRIVMENRAHPPDSKSTRPLPWALSYKEPLRHVDVTAHHLVGAPWQTTRPRHTGIAGKPELGSSKGTSTRHTRGADSPVIHRRPKCEKPPVLRPYGPEEPRFARNGAGGRWDSRPPQPVGVCPPGWI